MDPAFIGIGIIVVAIAALLWVQQAMERAGMDDRSSRMTRVLLVLGAIGAIYVLLAQR